MVKPFVLAICAIPVIFALLLVLFIFWPVIYGKLTHTDVTTEQNKYINKIEKVLN